MGHLDDQELRKEIAAIKERLVSLETRQFDISQRLSDVKADTDSRLAALVYSMAGRSVVSEVTSKLVLRASGAVAARKVLVLIVEDDPKMLQLYQVRFGASFEVFTVRRVLDAAPYLAAFGARIDLLILDVALPDGNGLEVLRDLRAIPGGAWVPVLVASAFGLDIEREAIRISGPNSICWVVDKTDVGDFLRDKLSEGLGSRRDSYHTMGPVAPPKLK